MSQQGPILVVSHANRASFASALDEAKLFPLVETKWRDAAQAVEQVQPAAVIADSSDAKEADKEAGNETAGHADLASLASRIVARAPYLPLIAVDPDGELPDNAIPFFQSQGSPARLLARLNAALRVRALHATVMRRLAPPLTLALSDIDTFRDATVLLIGRGGAYPALSVALGERTGVVGALSIEAAAKHLNARDIDGIVLGEGFGPRVMDAFLTVLTEDARFRNLPVMVTSDQTGGKHDLPNLEILSAAPAQIASIALPLIRQHAFEARLSRTLRAIDADGLIDARTGLLARAAFDRDFATAVYQTLERGGGLSVARFAFDPTHPRAQFDGARIISRLMRQMDFGAAEDDGSVIVVFAGAELRDAHMIARRLSSVMRHTSHGKREVSAEPVVTVATLLPNDSAKSLLARLYQEARRAAS
jgi:hypothetical protein